MASSSDHTPNKRPGDAPGGSGSGNSPDGGGDCPECGRHFASRKALFGHMRSHPERNWRGIVPPSRPIELELLPPSTTALVLAQPESYSEEETHAAADSLLLLSQSNPIPISSLPPATSSIPLPFPPPFTDLSSSGGPLGPFECSQCTRAFDSFQALGGHCSSHRSVKGFFATATEQPPLQAIPLSIAPPKLSSFLVPPPPRPVPRPGELPLYRSGSTHEYKCSVCHKTFPTGQALGGHMRWHLERDPLPPRGASSSSSSTTATSATATATTRWVPLTTTTTTVSIPPGELWGPSIRWLQERTKRQGVTLGFLPPQPPHSQPPPRAAFHPSGWSGPRGYSLMGPWKATASSSNPPLGFQERPHWFPGSASSSTRPDFMQVLPGILAVTTTSTVVTTVAGVSTRGDHLPPAPPSEAEMGRTSAHPHVLDYADDGDQSSTGSSDSNIDLDLKLGR